MNNIETVTRIERQYGQYSRGVKVMHKYHWYEVENVARPYSNQLVAVLTVKKIRRA